MSADGTGFAPQRQFILGLADELIVDLFAGGGGMSTAIEQALGRHVDISANHSETAVSMHRANHPQTRHFKADVFEVDPRAVTRGRKVGLLHMSPDCTHFSQAKGGQHRSTKIRGLSWVGVRWVGQLRRAHGKGPRVLTMENVKQIRTWGPLIAKRCPDTGRVVTLDEIPNPKGGKPINRVATVGERVPVENQWLVPDPRHTGRTWKRFIHLLQSHGYVVEHRLLVAADYGAPTSRERLFLVARCDGEPIVWPAPTHFKNPAKGQKKWRAAAECIDWSIPCPSIFCRKKDLAEATLQRVARGLKRYVLDAASPFIVPATHQGSHRMHDIGDPLPTITAAHRGELMVVSPHLQQFTQKGKNHSAESPLNTITTAKGGEHMVIAPHLLKIRGDSDGGSLAAPLPTITSGAGSKRPAGHAHAMGVISPMLIQAGHGEGESGARRWSHGINDIQGPAGTVTASGGGVALAAAMLVQTGYGERDGQAPRSLDIGAPLGTVVAGGAKHAAVVAFMAQHNTMPERESGKRNIHPGHPVTDPVSTVTKTGSQQGLVAASIVTLRGDNTGSDASDPLRTTSAGGQHQALIEYQLAPEHEAGALRVAAFLINYYGNGQPLDLRDPLDTITTRDRLAMVTVWIHGHPYVVVDIGLRMLKPRELYNAQGFPPDYIIDRGDDGRRFTGEQQVRMVGNSVSPPPGAALLRANFTHEQVAAGRRRKVA